jgi:hypothetical protein
MSRSAWVLALILGLGGALRFVGLEWGIPPYDAALSRGTDLRTSFHPDEDRILWQLEGMRPESLDFNPRDFGWGTLQTYLVGLTLAAAQMGGAFPEGWRAAFREAIDLPRIFATGRLVSALFGVFTVAIVYRMAPQESGSRGALAGAAVLAVSPLHVVHSHFLTTDVGLSFWVALTLLFLSRSRHFLAGLAAGAALATKSSALVLVPLLLLAQLDRRERKGWVVYPALVLAFLIAQPYAVIDFPRWWEAMRDLARSDTVSAGLAPAGLIARQGFHLGFYGVGPVALGLALVWLWRRRREPFARLLGLATLILLASLGIARLPFARYALPLVPIVSVAAGLALADLAPRRALLAGVAAILPPLLLSAGQLVPLKRPHTAQRAAAWIDDHLAPGSRIAQLWHEYPLLDGNRYSLSLFEDPFALQGPPARPLEAALVVVDNFPLVPFRPEFLADLASNYRLAETFREPPRLGPLVLPEPWAPHDWKYTHPQIQLFLRK